jgi:hypothetical protein
VVSAAAKDTSSKAARSVSRRASASASAIRDEYLIVDAGKLAGTGAHSYRTRPYGSRVLAEP